MAVVLGGEAPPVRQAFREEKGPSEFGFSKSGRGTPEGGGGGAADPIGPREERTVRKVEKCGDVREGKRRRRALNKGPVWEGGPCQGLLAVGRIFGDGAYQRTVQA